MDKISIHREKLTDSSLILLLYGVAVFPKGSIFLKGRRKIWPEDRKHAGFSFYVTSLSLRIFSLSRAGLTVFSFQVSAVNPL